MLSHLSVFESLDLKKIKMLFANWRLAVCLFFQGFVKSLEWHTVSRMDNF